MQYHQKNTSMQYHQCNTINRIFLYFVIILVFIFVQMSFEQYVDWNVFENLPEKSFEISYSERNEEGTTNEITIENTIKKFICQAPIGSGKSTALRKWPNNKFILVIPTINIAMEFYSKLYVALNNNHPKNIDEIIKVCIKEGAFKEFKAAITHFVPVVITKVNWFIQ